MKDTLAPGDTFIIQDRGSGEVLAIFHGPGTISWEPSEVCTNFSYTFGMQVDVLRPERLCK